MKDDVITKAAGVVDTTERTNIARQYVQRQILASLSGSLAFRSLAFVGGTCLRFIRGLRRYSEDMDFSVESESYYEPERWMERIGIELERQGFIPKISWKPRRAVDFGWVRIPYILHELGVAATRDQQLSINPSFLATS